ncbi:MAG: myo-inositol-1(or 4)-monophosphatase [Rhodobacteraceae bacterium HLUCCA12]|nr:MAG: myo-inositol-1(or 4)-monophosphatase [Rhodobacteraceae bacterium HLUCCA12]
MPEPDRAPFHTELALLLDAARGAGTIAAQHFRRGPRVWDKGGEQGPVTEADLAVNDFLRARLTAARPDYGWLSEESDPLGDLSRLTSKKVFVIDPIDGTRAFIDGQKSFAHALAVVIDGHPVAAVVHLPLMELTYTATLGGGARLNDRPVRASLRTGLTGARVLATRPNLDERHWPGGVPDVERHFRPSLAWRLALVGEGAFDALITLRDAWDWDIAAAALIASESGVRISDRDGAALRFNRAEATNPGVLAAPAPLHRSLMSARGLPNAASLCQDRQTTIRSMS